MSLELDSNEAKFQIRAYRPGQIKINDQLFTQSIIVSADRLIDNWPPQQISELKPEHLTIITELNPRVLLIGTGSTLEFPAMEIYGELINAGIGVEIMDTHAACRTYVALTAENRNVVAALMIK